MVQFFSPELEKLVFYVGAESALNRPQLAGKPFLTLEEEKQLANLQYFSFILHIKKVISSVNLFVQLMAIILVVYRHSTHKGPFFSFVLTFAVSVSCRVFLNTIALAVDPGSSNNDSKLSRASLFVDYCSSLFSITLTFFLSLNRCLCFVAEQWNRRVFEGTRVFFTIIFTTLISVMGGVGIVLTSRVRRLYAAEFGFFDVSTEDGFKVSINRSFNMFPVGSILCYIILFVYLRNKNKKSSLKSMFAKRGEHKVFAQLIVTSVLYTILNAFYEVVASGQFDIRVEYILPMLHVLTICNYFPELSLSLFFVLDTVNFDKIRGTCFGPSRDHDRGQHSVNIL